jgi:hypothetical protein
VPLEPSATTATAIPSNVPTTDSSPRVSDGRQSEWQTVTDPFGGPLAQQVDGLFTGTTGNVVAWGSTQRVLESSASVHQTSLWNSPDGKVWSQQSFTEEDENYVVNAIASDGTVYVAVGLLADRGATWSSVNGLAWSPASIEPIPDAEESNIYAVKAGPAGWLAVGETTAGHGGAWWSADGRAWKAIARDFPSGRFYDLTATAQGFLVVGVLSSDSDSDAVAWLVSPDGDDWQSVNAAEAFGGPRNEALRRVFVVADGYVAFGDSYDEHSGDSCAECFPGPNEWRTWTSPDGFTWQRHDRNDEAEPATYRSLTATSDGLAAIARGVDNQVWLWQSGDGLTWTRQGDAITIDVPGGDSATVHASLVTGTHLVGGGYLVNDDGFVVIGP